MTRHFACWMIVALVPLTWSMSGASRADERRPADLLPASTVFYAELDDPGAAAEVVRDHPLMKRFTAFDQVRQSLESKDYLQFRALVSILEARTGKTWPDLLATGAGEGVAFAFDAQTKSGAVIVKAVDETTLPDLLATLVELARQDASNKGEPDPIKSGEYRGITAYQIDKAKVATAGPWMVIVGEQELGKSILDTLLDQPAATLAADPQFQKARNAAANDAAGWAYVNVAAIRSAGAAAKLFEGRTDNPVAELLIGGLLSTLRESTYVTASLHARHDALRLQLASPFDATWVPEARAYYFGADATGAAPPLVSLPGTVLSLSAYRDVSQMWLRAGDLFDQRTQDELAKADSNLTTLFSGKDFGTDVLGSVRPPMQLVVQRQEFPADRKPAIELPAFALVLQLKDPETMRPEFRRTFQSLIGFLNVVGAQNGQPQLDLGSETKGEAQIVSASYLVGENDNPKRLPINFNFAPSVAFAGDRFVISSTKGLATSLIQAQPAELAAGGDGAATNTQARIDFGVLRDILADNRGQLIAQNMLDKGHTKGEAEAEIGTFLELIDFLRNGSATLTAGKEQLRLTFELQLAVDG